MKIDLVYPINVPLGPEDHEKIGVGGTENFIIHSAEMLEQLGHDVRVYTMRPTLNWFPLQYFNPGEDRDVLVSFRIADFFESLAGAPYLKALILADTESVGLGDRIREGQIDLAMFVSQWQADKIIHEEDIDRTHVMITSNGVKWAKWQQVQTERMAGKCIHIATPERGLEPLLDIWPAIQAQVPYAELHLYSSFLGWRVTEEQNMEMAGALYERIERMKADGLNIFNLVHGNAAELQAAMCSSMLYLYPTRHFNETCCISALEAAAAGVPIIATARAAMRERVEHGETGYLLTDIDEEAHDEQFVTRTVQLLSDMTQWERMSEAARHGARNYDYSMLVRRWEARWMYESSLRR